MCMRGGLSGYGRLPQRACDEVMDGVTAGYLLTSTLIHLVIQHEEGKGSKRPKTVHNKRHERRIVGVLGYLRKVRS